MEIMHGKAAELGLARERFAEFSANLRARGFADCKPPPDQRVVVGAGSVTSLSKSFTSFDLIIGAKEDFGRYAIEVSSGRRSASDIPLSIWARFECEGGGSVDMITHSFPKKSHHNTPSLGGRWGYMYVANLVPSDDAGEIIRGCIALNDAVERIRKDPGFRNGLEAKEVFDALTAAIKGISGRNSLKGSVGAGLDQYNLGWWNKYSFEVERIKLDQGLLHALDAVADR
jgi:hypothetical protein